MDQVKISVRGLIEFVMRSGDIDDTFISSKRAREGQEIHTMLQKEYGDHYKKEVYLKNTTIINNIGIHVEGRADGIYHNNHEALVDEIKSTTRSLDDLEYNSNPLHWAQCKCYGYFYCLQNKLEKIGIQLTYYQVETKEVKRLYKSFTLEELKDFYFDLLTLYLDFSKLILDYKKRRDTSIEVLNFPFANYRKGQRKLSVGVYNTIKEGKNLLVEAPTGIGKTMSTLFPAIKSIGGDLTDKIFYLTARSTTKEAANSAIYKLMNKGLNIKSTTITAKEKICINTKVSCNPKDCPYAKGHFDRVNDCIIDIFENEDILQMEVITQYAKKHRVCPMEFQLDMALYSDVIICDYNYVFDPMVYLKRFFEGSVERHCFLVDESHNLVDRGRAMYSIDLSFTQIDEVISKLEHEDEKIKKALAKIVETMMDNFQRNNKGVEKVVKNLDDDIISWSMVAMRRMEKFLSEKKDRPYYDIVLELYFQLFRLTRISEFYSDAFVSIYQKNENGLFYRIMCVDTSEIFGNILSRGKTTVFFSATLSPIKFYGELLGAGDDYYHLRLPSPFDEKNLRVSVLPISTRYADREGNIEAITKYIQNFVKDKGNTMIFFPSYSFQNKVLDRFDPVGKRILVQSQKMTEEDRERFLMNFTYDSNICAFVVLGGVFSEGIDLVGKRLENAIIVSVGLPGLSLETEIIRDYFDDKEGKGFDYAYIYPGMNKVSQAAGRVIRTKDDKGNVLLIDDRFMNYKYRRLLPIHWGKMAVESIK